MTETEVKTLKESIVHLVTAYQGLKAVNLELMIGAAYPSVSNAELTTAISELVQVNEIERIEYQVKDNRSMFLSFYLPPGSRLV